MSFRIEPGQVAAVVGPTGAGNPSIISLIPRFCEPDSGCVKIDGKDIRRFTQQSLRRQISLVLQETVLFHAPVWSNIAYGKPGATRSEILRAAEIANAHEFIEKMPEGYNTVIGERGVTLSGGQRQRIAIARAVIRDTSVLILDEPSSGLDAASETLVFEALNRLMAGKTPSSAIAEPVEPRQFEVARELFQDHNSFPFDFVIMCAGASTESAAIRGTSRNAAITTHAPCRRGPRLWPSAASNTMGEGKPSA